MKEPHGSGTVGGRRADGRWRGGRAAGLPSSVLTDYTLGPNNHLIALARRARRRPNLLLTLVLAVGFLSGGQALVGLPAVVLLWAATDLTPSAVVERASTSAVLSGLAWAMLLILSYAGVYLLLWIWLRRVERRPLWTLGFEPAGALGKVARGALSGVAMIGAAVGLMALAGFVSPEQGPPQLSGSAAVPGALIALAGWAVQGPAEEAVCRGWMLPAIAIRHGLRLAIGVSSLFFAAVHGLNPGVSAIGVLNLALYGLFAALYALREGGLWGVGANHALWNWAQGNLFGLQVSGTATGGGALVDLLENGPDEVTGGPFGPEGGLAVTVVLAAGIVWLATRRGPGRAATRGRLSRPARL